MLMFILHKHDQLVKHMHHVLLELNADGVESNTTLLYSSIYPSYCIGQTANRQITEQWDEAPWVWDVAGGGSREEEGSNNE